ncbi:MAG TPA: CerR family C-terminal domain-containing protein [Syntrophorhabdaceae bacterium]|jgi:AcrR family transcriptional regulator
MKALRKDAEQTRQSLLAAGREIFAEKGYRDTTIADICERASANLAAVNYHFGDKANLYSESWRYAFLKSIKTYPPDGGVPGDAPPEERLRGQVSALLRRISDRDNKEFFIALKEFANPTGLLEQIILDEVNRLNKRTESVLRELLGAEAPERDIQFFVISIVSQCVNMIVAESSKESDRPNRFGFPKIEDVEAYINHVVRLTLAGISSTRQMLAHGGSKVVRDE